MATFKPEFDYLLVEEDDDQKQTESGLYMPQTTQEDDIRFGVVVDSGPGSYKNGEFVSVDREKGDKIAWKGFSDISLRFEGDEYTLVPNESIIGHVEEDEDS